MMNQLVQTEKERRLSQRKGIMSWLRQYSSVRQQSKHISMQSISTMLQNIHQDKLNKTKNNVPHKPQKFPNPIKNKQQVTQEEMNSQSMRQFFKSNEMSLQNSGQISPQIEKLIAFQENNSKNITQSQQVLGTRKSKRIHQKQLRQKNLSYVSSISKQKQQKKQLKILQQDEMNRSLIDHLQNPTNATLRGAQITYIDRMFHLSITVLNEEYCQKHMTELQEINQQKFDDQGQEIFSPTIQEKQRQLKIKFKQCTDCIKPGKYWFSKQQLIVLNGELWRIYVQSFIEQNVFSQRG